MKKIFIFPKWPALFADHLTCYGVDKQLFIEHSGVSAKTFSRYINNNTAPEWAYKLTWLLAGHLPFAGWEGWQIRLGGLSHPCAPSTKNRPILPEELKDFAYRLQSIHTLQTRIEQLEKQLIDQSNIVDLRTWRNYRNA